MVKRFHEKGEQVGMSRGERTDKPTLRYQPGLARGYDNKAVQDFISMYRSEKKVRKMRVWSIMDHLTTDWTEKNPNAGFYTFDGCIARCEKLNAAEEKAGRKYVATTFGWAVLA